MKKNRKVRKTKGKPVIYLDTNFILDVTEGRNNNSIHIMEKIRENKWVCASSAFTIMEISDTIKDTIFVNKKLQKHWTIPKILRERYAKDLNRDDFKDVEAYIDNKVLGAHKFIKFLTPDNDGWIAAVEFSANSNIAAPDIMHLVIAWNVGCNILITSDKQFLANAKNLVDRFKHDYPGLEEIMLCTPETFNNVLKEFRS